MYFKNKGNLLTGIPWVLRQHLNSKAIEEVENQFSSVFWYSGV